MYGLKKLGGATMLAVTSLLGAGAAQATYGWLTGSGRLDNRSSVTV